MGDEKPWFENDRFWEATETFLFSERILSIASEEVDKILRLLEIKSGAAVLDLCCGPGRHTLELARRGYVVTGVDRYCPYLNKARKDAAGKNLDIEFVLEDMRRFRRIEAFDAVINYFTSFGYFDNDEDEKLVLRNIFQSLKPGGQLLMEMVGKEIVTRRFEPREWGEKDGVYLLHEHEPLDNWTYIKSRRILVNGVNREEFVFTLRLYSAWELKTLMQESGFSEVKIYGDIEGSPYNHKAKRLVALAQK